MADLDILIGPGRLYRAPLATANPDETTVAFGAAWTNWTAMGDLLEGSGVTLSMEEEYTKVYTELSTAPVTAVRNKREPMIKCTLAEHSGDNLALILDGTKTDTAAGASQKGYSSIPFGVNTGVDFYKWGLEGFRYDSAGTQQPIRYFFHKGFLSLAGDVNFSKADPTGIPIEITVLADRSQSAGSELGELQIVTAPASS